MFNICIHLFYRTMFALALVTKLFSLLFFFLALRFYIPPKNEKVTESDDEIHIETVNFRKPDPKLTVDPK